MAALRQHAVFLLILLCLAGLFLSLAWFDELGTLQGDGLIYLLTARHYAPYWPPGTLAATYASVTQFPPLYSALLAATGAAADFRLAHVVTAVSLLGAFAAFYAWLISLGIPRLRASAGMALFAAMPGTFVQPFYLHPEGLYVALTFAALVLLALGERTGRARFFWSASAVIGLATLTRTVGVALLPALLAALYRHRPRGWIGMLAAAAVPALLWAVVHEPGWRYSDTLVETYVGASVSAMVQSLASSISAAAAGMARNVAQTSGLIGIVIVVGAAAAAVALWRFGRWRPDAWYLLAYLATIAIWPYPQEAQRLTWVVMPVLLGYVLWAGGQAVARASPALANVRPLLAWVPAAVLALIILPGFALLAGRAVHPAAQANPDLRHLPEWYGPRLGDAHRLAAVQLRIVQGLGTFATRIPEGECAFSSMPLIASFYTGRDAYFPPWESENDRSFDEQIQRDGCRFFVLTVDPGRGYTRPYYPLDRVRDRIEIVAEHSIGQGPSDQQVVVALAVLKRK